MSAILLRALLDHVEEMEPLCDELPPPSPYSRPLAAGLCNRLSALHVRLADALRDDNETDDDERDDDDERNPPRPRDPDTRRSSARQQPRDARQRNESPRPARRRHNDACVTVAATRTTRILTHLGRGHVLSPPDVVQGLLLARHDHVKAADREDLAFVRLLHDLPSASPHDWEEALGAIAGDHLPTTHTSIIVNSTAHDDIAGLSERITARHKALATTLLANTAHSTVSFILFQIDNLKFAADWQERRALPRGKSWASTFFKTAFIQDPDFAPQFVGLTGPAIQRKLDELAPRFDSWRNAARHAISARARLLRLYNTFGPAVLLDTSWAVDRLVNAHSRSFVAVFNSVLDAITPAQLQPVSRSRHALVHIVSALGGGNEVTAHIQRFLDDHPPCC